MADCFSTSFVCGRLKTLTKESPRLTEAIASGGELTALPTALQAREWNSKGRSSGRLPLLAKRGFHGEIVTTAASRELARLVMLDAAHLQEEDAARRRRQQRRRGIMKATSPLYTELDTLNTMDLFGRTAAYDTSFAVAPGVTATFLDAGHILGSASVLLDVDEGGTHRKVLFSGDLGNADRPIVRNPAQPPQADAVVLETTYGDRLAASVDELYAVIDEALRRGGNVIIPTFALERAQELLFFLRTGVECGRLPRTMQVFVDSPMAISATDIGFSAHADQAELLAWHRHTGAARTFLVHGELDPMQRFAALLQGTHVDLPELHQTFVV